MASKLKVYRTDQELNLEYCSLFRIDDSGIGWASSSSDMTSDSLSESSTASSLSSISLLIWDSPEDLLEELLRGAMTALDKVVGRFSYSSGLITGKAMWAS